MNTRTGWYSKRVAAETNTGAAGGFAAAEGGDASWSRTPLAFPRIQGADVCGGIVAVSDDVDPSRIRERVLVRNMLHFGSGSLLRFSAASLSH
ncbi:hypothetical protein [Mesorhizobium sp. M0809]|uniref:hypothetical protein n=1 Tax=Mesorhizobium sp. M0809 TaxID=2957003 RepID=UPI00333A2811